MRLFFFAALFLKPVFAAVYTDPSTLPNASYTHIIVGGTSKRLLYASVALSDTCLAGLGGSVLANRLSAKPNNRVLLIEAGPRFVLFFLRLSASRGLMMICTSATVNPFIPIPFLCPTLAPSDVSWNYTTVPQTGLEGRSIAYPRGRTLGGSTSISTSCHVRIPCLRT